MALLRGINVGGKNIVPMKDLAAIFGEAGATGVQTYIQSGNVVFSATDEIVNDVPGRVSKELSARFGLSVPVVMRTAQELRYVAVNNPFLQADTDQKALHVAFLASLPGPSAVEALNPDRSPPDEFSVHGREIYLRCPNGLARTRLTNAYFDSALGTTSTVRNWRTVHKLLELAGGDTRPAA